MKDFRKKCVVALVGLLALGMTGEVDALELDIPSFTNGDSAQSALVPNAPAQDALAQKEDAPVQSAPVQSTPAKNNAPARNNAPVQQGDDNADEPADSVAGGNQPGDGDPQDAEEDLQAKDSSADAKEKKDNTDNTEPDDGGLMSEDEPNKVELRRKVSLRSLGGASEGSSNAPVEERLRSMDKVILSCSTDGTIDGDVAYFSSKKEFLDRSNLDQVILDAQDRAKVDKALDLMVDEDKVDRAGNVVKPKKGKITVTEGVVNILNTIAYAKKALLNAQFEKLGILRDKTKQEAYIESGYREGSVKNLDLDAVAKRLNQNGTALSQSLQELQKYNNKKFNEILTVVSTITNPEDKDAMELAMARVKEILKGIWDEKNVEEAIPNEQVFKEFVVRFTNIVEELNKEKDKTSGDANTQPGTLNDTAKKRFERQIGILGKAAKAILGTDGSPSYSSKFRTYTAKLFSDLMEKDFANASAAFMADITNAEQSMAPQVKLAASGLKKVYETDDTKALYSGLFDTEGDFDVNDNIASLVRSGAFRAFANYLVVGFQQNGVLSKDEKSALAYHKLILSVYNKTTAKINKLSNLINDANSVFQKDALGAKIISWFIMKRSAVLMEILKDAQGADTITAALKLSTAYDAALSPKVLPELVSRMAHWSTTLGSHIKREKGEGYVVNVLEKNKDAIFAISVLADALYEPFGLLLEKVSNINPQAVRENKWLSTNSKYYVINMLSAKGIMPDLTLLELVSLHLQNQHSMLRLLYTVDDANFPGAAVPLSNANAKKVNPKMTTASATFGDYAATVGGTYTWKGEIFENPLYGLTQYNGKGNGGLGFIGNTSGGASSSPSALNGYLFGPLFAVTNAGREFGAMVARSISADPTKGKAARSVWTESIAEDTSGIAFDTGALTNGSNYKFTATVPAGITALFGQTSILSSNFAKLLEYSVESLGGASADDSLYGKNGLFGNNGGSNADTQNLNPYTMIKSAPFNATAPDLEYISSLINDATNAIKFGSENGIISELGVKGEAYTAKNVFGAVLTGLPYSQRVGGYLVNALTSEAEKKAAFVGSIAQMYGEQDYKPVEPVQQQQPQQPDMSSFSQDQLLAALKQRGVDISKLALPSTSPSPFYNPGTGVPVGGGYLPPDRKSVV